MKKSEIILNILLLTGFILLIIAFSLLISDLVDNWNGYYEGLQQLDNWDYIPSSIKEEMSELYNKNIQSTISEIFISFCALIDLVVLLIIDVPLIKAKLKSKKENNN